MTKLKQVRAFPLFAVIAAGCLSVAGCGGQTSGQATSPSVSVNTVVVSSDASVEVAPQPNIAKIPDWCLNLPENSVFRIYACGSAKSDSLSMARSRADLDAKRQLASIIDGAVSAAVSETTTGSLSTSETTTSDEVVDIPIRGYRKLEQTSLTIGETYHYFVLLEMEIGPAAALMTKALQSSIDDYEPSCPEGFKRVEGGCVSY